MRKTRHSPLAAAALLLAAGFLLTACDDESDTVITRQVGGTAIVSNFPGDDVLNHLVGDDGAAFNNSGTKVTKGLQVFWNGDNGHAIVLYLDNRERLWAHYWNGTTFTPPVELRGPNQEAEDEDDDNDVNQFDKARVLFLNTSGHSDANARARDGDAIVLWDRDDVNPPSGVGDPDEDSNHRLFASYFDRSLSGVAQSAPGVMYGFQTLGTTIDFDNISDTGDDDVTVMGFVSDSLSGTHMYDERENSTHESPYHRFNNDASDLSWMPATRSGDPTTFVYLFWGKGQSSGSTTIAPRFHYSEFDLTQVGNAFAPQTALGQNEVPLPAGITLDATDSSDLDELVVHNGCIMWSGNADTGATGLFMTCFPGPGGNPTTIEVSQSVHDSIAPGASIWDGTNPDEPELQDVYGGDHGLASLYMFFEVFGGPQGDMLAVAKVDLDRPITQDDRELERFDDPTRGSVFRLDHTRIARDGSWIIGILQQDPLNGGFRQILVNAVQTRPVGSALRTLPNSLVGTQAAGNQMSPVDDPNFVVIQSELADGRFDPLCGIQSNVLRMNFAWGEVEDGINRLYHNGFTINLSADPGTPPTGSFPLEAGGLLAEHDTTFDPYDSDTGLNPIVGDLGTTGGEAIVYFLRNGNFPTDASNTSAFDEVRVYGIPAIAGVTPDDAVLVSSDGTDNENAMNDEIDEIDDFDGDAGQFLRLKTTPRSRAGGSHGGSIVHLFFVEPRGSSPDSFPGLRTRRFVKASFNSAILATFSTSHVPVIGTDPIALSLDSREAHIPPAIQDDEDEAGPLVSLLACDGNTVGVFFQGPQHFLYQEFDGSDWMRRDGVVTPELIDTLGSLLFPGRDQRAFSFPAWRIGSCNDLSGTLTFFSQPRPGDDFGARRWFVRVRD